MGLKPFLGNPGHLCLPRREEGRYMVLFPVLQVPFLDCSGFAGLESVHVPLARCPGAPALGRLQAAQGSWENHRARGPCSSACRQGKLTFCSGAPGWTWVAHRLSATHPLCQQTFYQALPGLMGYIGLCWILFSSPRSLAAGVLTVHGRHLGPLRRQTSTTGPDRVASPVAPKPVPSRAPPPCGAPQTLKQMKEAPSVRAGV